MQRTSASRKPSHRLKPCEWSCKVNQLIGHRMGIVAMKHARESVHESRKGNCDCLYLENSWSIITKKLICESRVIKEYLNFCKIFPFYSNLLVRKIWNFCYLKWDHVKLQRVLFKYYLCGIKQLLESWN